MCVGTSRGRRCKNLNCVADEGRLTLWTKRLSAKLSKYPFNTLLISKRSNRKKNFPICQHISASLASRSNLLPFKNASGDKAGRVKYLYWNLKSVRR